MRRIGILIIAGCLLAAAGGQALASGFSVYEQSAKASGQAGAWVARADDAAANWYNPAALAWIDGTQMQFGFNVITIGSDTTFNTSDINFGYTSPTSIDAVTNNVTPIHAYFAKRLNEKVVWGVGVNNPIGLVTEWDETRMNLSHKKAELVTFVVNGNVAWQLNDNWAMAFGLNYMYADVGEFSRLIDVSALLEAPPFTYIGSTDLSGDGDDWGFNTAVHYKTDGWSFGFTYRTEFKPKIEGDATFTNIPEPLAAFFPNGPGSTTLDLPEQAAIGVAWDVNDDWVMEFDISYAGWSSFKSLDIDFTNETPAVTDISLREDWDDTMCFRLGAAYKMSDKHEWRFGALFDQAPTRPDTMRPSIPDGDRKSVTFGYGYKGAKWDFDAYYMPLFFDDGEAAGNPLEGVITGTYETFVHLFGATWNYRF
jgi:long-chain fatty acid transport protein